MAIDKQYGILKVRRLFKITMDNKKQYIKWLNVSLELERLRNEVEKLRQEAISNVHSFYKKEVLRSIVSTFSVPAEKFRETCEWTMSAEGFGCPGVPGLMVQ